MRMHTAQLVVSLRDFIRRVLDLDPVPAGCAIPEQGPLRIGREKTMVAEPAARPLAAAPHVRWQIGYQYRAGPQKRNLSLAGDSI